MRIAITRAISPSLNDCELTHLERQPIDLDLARAQHRQYEEALAALGREVLRLPAAADLPDSVFVEDTAIVLDEVAIITRPGAKSRRPETMAIADALAAYRRLSFLEAPATLDGGDVLRIGNRLFVGLSARSNQAAIEQLRFIAEPFGYQVEGVGVNGCLHLKSAVTEIAENTLLINRQWVDATAFGKKELIEISPMEPFGANALRVGEAVIYPKSFPQTRQRMIKRGISVVSVEASELAKAEGGVTCCSLLFTASSDVENG